MSAIELLVRYKGTIGNPEGNLGLSQKTFVVFVIELLKLLTPDHKFFSAGTAHFRITETGISAAEIAKKLTLNLRILNLSFLSPHTQFAFVNSLKITIFRTKIHLS